MSINKNFLSRILLGCMILSFFTSVSAGNMKNTEVVKNRKEAPAGSLPMEMADPTIFHYKGTYYLYGTGGDSNNGILVYTSTDLKNWKGPKGIKNGYALTKGDSFGTKGFWAPQVFLHKGKIYMAYTANEQIAIAESDSPLGPFHQTILKKISGADNQIDPYVFFDTTGKPYLYHVRLQYGNKIYVAELKEDLTDIIPETSKICIQGEQPWENTANSSYPVTEGPTVLKHNNLYYLFYSANDFRNIDYAVGYAVSNSPLGPWTKYKDNPMISRKLIPENGTGHGDFFTDNKGNWKYVFHFHASGNVVSPRRTGIINAAFVPGTSGVDRLECDKKTFVELNVKSK